MASNNSRARPLSGFERKSISTNIIEKIVKSKLPCCKNNQKSPNALWECSYCECAFESADQRDAHNREIHPEQLAVKRKMKCCDNRKSKRLAFDYHHQCRYCHCMFPNKTGCDYHMKHVHQCKNGATMVADDHEEAARIAHLEQLQPKQDMQLELLQYHRQREMDDDFILVYVKANKLHEYRPQLDYQPDFSYIFRNRFERDELVRLVKKFKKEFIMQNFRFGSAEIIDLAEKGALSVEDIAGLLDYQMHWFHREVAFVSYLLDKNYKIKPNWVPRFISDDELMRRIKQTHTFTFNELCVEWRKNDLFSDICDWEKFHTQAQKHFPDPNFNEESD